MKPLDLTGQCFGELTVVRRAENHQSPCGARFSAWFCKCSCGNQIIVIGSDLKRGHTKSCGCYKKARAEADNLKHGGSRIGRRERLYKVWANIVQRTCNPSNREFRWYGAIGVSICDDWRNDYASFRNWAYANGYDENAKRGICTIDRIDPSKSYCPENCRFVDMVVQNNNKRNGGLESAST